MHFWQTSVPIFLLLKPESRRRLERAVVKPIFWQAAFALGESLISGVTPK